MKKAIQVFSAVVFICGSSAFLFLCFLSLLRLMIAVGPVVLQVIAVVLLLCLIVAYFVGAVVLVRWLIKRNATISAAPAHEDFRHG